MFDYFNSTRKANQILAGVKKAFKSEDLETVVECQGNSASLVSGKFIFRLRKLDSIMWKVCAPLVIILKVAVKIFQSFTTKKQRKVS